MNQKRLRLSQRYATALRAHLRPGARASSQPALKLGRQAVTLHLETLELARMHEAALAALGLTRTTIAVTKLAGNFFNEVNTFVEKDQRAARESQASLSRTQAALGMRLAELAISKRALQRGVLQRKALADAAEKNGRHYQRSLAESLQLQKQLRKLTHRVLTAQENERKNISRELQDEIAQTLLGINVRLLSLKAHARSNTKNFRAEIVSAQRLVMKSAESVRRVAREIGHEPGELS